MYKAILLDIDQTILDFNKAEVYAITKLLKSFGVTPTDDMIIKYHELDICWWQKYEKGLVTKEELLVNRFKEYFALYGIKCNDFSLANKEYLYSLGDVVYYIDDAYLFVKELSKKYDIYVITNGVTATQNRRLNKTNLLPFFKKVYISEQIGFAKPHKEFFNYVLDDIKMAKEDCLIIGDSLTSDMQGGINSNIDTCWFNPENKIDTLGVKYQINTLMEFFKLDL